MKPVIPQNSLKASLIGWAASLLIRTISLTLRYRLSDPHGIATLPTTQRIIWIFWHNRIFCQPIIYRKFLKHRTISVLTSASKDGALIAQTVRRFGLGAVRGSSSKRAAQAGAELVDCLQSGSDIGMTPDGPRGPCYKLAMGPVRLSQMTGTAIVSINANPERYWQLKSWDRFRIPKPFSKLNVSFGRPEIVQDHSDDLESERARIEAYLMEQTD
jgi:lysophospholipid acyltransferase (LPLAT)-like uncharacterized protein